MSKDILADVERVRGGFHMDSQITVTQLARSTNWRHNLEKFAVMPVLDRNQTAAIVISPDAYRSLMQYIDRMEEELEAAQLDHLLRTREHMEDWEEGDTLTKKAKASFNERQEQLRGLLDGDSE